MSESTTDENVSSQKDQNVTPSPKKDQENLRPIYQNGHARDEFDDASSDSPYDPSDNNHKRVLAGYDTDAEARKRSQKRARKRDRANGKKGYRSSNSFNDKSNIFNHPDLFKRNANNQANPSSRASTLPSERQSKSTKDPKHALPATDYAPAYDSKLFSLLLKDKSLPCPLDQHFEHLNCFHLTHAQSISPPSIVQLKQHTQAMCLLLHLLCPSDHSSWPHVAPRTPFPTAFDFLTNLKEPYSEEGEDLDESERLPLRSISNILASAQPGIGNVEGRNKAELLADADRILTRLDHVYNSTGGILSIPPPEPETDAQTGPADDAPPPTNLARDSILAQWLAHTRALTTRLASLEAETASLRQVLAHEAVVAGVRGKQSRAATSNGDGSGEREIIFPQDRYVLAGLSDGLWERLNEELSARERDNRAADEDAEAEAEAEAEQHERAQGRGVRARGSGPFSAAPGTDEPPERNVATWIEVSSRLYRARGHDAIFVMPGFGLDPGARALHAVERGPLVQAVPERRAGAGAGATAWERTVAREREALEKRIGALQEALRVVYAKLAAARREGRRGVEEAEMRGKVGGLRGREGRE